MFYAHQSYISTQLNSNLINTARELKWNKNKHIIMTENTQNIKYSANNFVAIDCYFGNISLSISMSISAQCKSINTTGYQYCA